MVAICPCCRQAVQPGALLVSLDTHEAARGDLVVKLLPQEAKVLVELRDAAPGAAKRDDLIYALYGYRDGAAHPNDALNTIMMRLRRKLAPLGARVTTIINHGYRLDIANG